MTRNYCIDRVERESRGFLGTVSAKKSSDSMDGSSFTMGLHTLMWQFHPDARAQYLSYMGQFVKSRVADPNRFVAAQ